ncbi:MAG: hypothetical protein HY237_06040 [Acidobacteria bacterium]|nr:hypothetical protein [Acidobacteriota bacterium]
MASVIRSGKLIQRQGMWHWGKRAQFMVQVPLDRVPSGKVPAAERYYCFDFYVAEEEAAGFRPGQPIRITIEQD